MPRYKLTLEYAGTRYSGWQIQKNARTVQGEIDRAVRTVYGRPGFELYGSGRTDAGVHALRQVAHLDLAAAFGTDALRGRLNDELPHDINILTIEKVTHRFHARHSAVARSYLYQIARRRPAFAKPFVWWIKEDLDVERMTAAAKRLEGMNDFGAFAARDGARDEREGERSTLVLIDRVEVQPDGDLLLVRVHGSHFLWKMVRRLVGVLADVGRGGLAPADVARLLTEADAPAASGLAARLTAPAAGLFLEWVFYEGDAQNPPLVAATPLGGARGSGGITRPPPSAPRHRLQ